MPMKLQLAVVGDKKGKEEGKKEKEDGNTLLLLSSSSYTSLVWMKKEGRNHITTRARPIT